MTTRPHSPDLLGPLRDSLLALPGVQAVTLDSPPRSSAEADSRLRLETKHGTVAVVVGIRQYGYPRDVRETADRLREGAGPGTLSLIAAPALSPGAREYLREREVGYWDSGGSLFLPLPWGLVLVDRPVPRSEERRIRELYRGKTARVLHFLLAEPEREWHLQEVASEAGVSTYTVHQVFRHLERRFWMDPRGRGPQRVRKLARPDSLLDDWAEHHSLTDYRQVQLHGLADSLDELEARLFPLLERETGDWALTLESGAVRVAPHITTVQRVSVLVPPGPDWSHLAPTVDLYPVDGGANVLLLESSDLPPRFHRHRVGDAWVAGDIQLYLDLWASPRRGREQARHLRRERLPF